MFDQALNLNNIFASLSDPTRRDILQRVARGEMTVGEIAQPYELSLAAVSKHLKILEKAKLIMKRRQGKQSYVTLTPHAFRDATEYLDWYKQQLEQRMDSLEEFLNKEQ